ncbi:MAG: ankyrin repeat domain-containing protein [Candidatus Gastranaerophilales bacterium]|nr:ankyrin repeat domain-containing protein [Candidatus Gastranaerophilales bacterium]
MHISLITEIKSNNINLKFLAQRNKNSEKPSSQNFISNPNLTEILRNNAMANINFGSEIDKTDELRKIIKEFPSVNEECTPEEYSEMYDEYLEKVQTYLKENNPENINLGLILSDVAALGHYKIVDYLIENHHADVNYVDKTNINMTPLLHAVAKGNSKTVEILCQKGADVTKKDSFTGYNALMLAVYVQNIKSLEIIAKANPNNLDDIDKQGYTALMTATLFGYYDFVEKLVKLGADINKVSNGKTALIHAVQNKKMMDKLKSLGANTSIKDEFGQTADEIYGAHQAWIGTSLMANKKVREDIKEQFFANMKTEQEETYNNRHPKSRKSIRKPGARR